MEKFVSFQLEELAFKDSLQFMNSSLEKLVENLADKADSKDELEFVFPHLKTYFDKHWSHLPKEAFEMLTRKGVYPYSYMDSFEKFDETQLPNREKFFNDLTKQHITEENWNFINRLRDTF